MTLEIQFRMQVKDLLEHIDEAYGGLDGLGRYLDRHPRDPGRTLLYEAAMHHRDHPRRVLTFGHAYIGDPRKVFGAAKIELLEYLMHHPGLGLRELARALERSPATVAEHLAELEGAGLILRRSGGAGRAASLQALPREVHIRLTQGPPAEA